MDNYLDLMRARREQILERFYAALDRAGRPHDAASLIAVSKTVGVDETVAAIQAGYRHFAENRPQELVRKLTRVLIEVNVSGEESKGGFSPDEIRAAAGELAELEGICVQGLMTMAPRGNKDVARRTFAGLRELRDELEAAHPDLNLPELSCGMSEDFESALEEGSTLVRLGRVVFNPEFAVK